jgi:flagellar hook-length control protein FliK
VPQVASDVQAYINTRPMPLARPTPAPDQAPVTPFASLLDDSTQGAPDSPPPQASDDRPSSADRLDWSQPPARDNGSQAADAKVNTQPLNASSADSSAPNSKSADVKSADTKATDTKPANAQSTNNATDDISVITNSFDAANAGKTSNADKTASNSKAKRDAKAAADAKIAAQNTSGDDAKPVSYGKQADGQAVAGATAAPATTPIPTVAPADAVATVLAPVPGVVPQAASPANVVTGATASAAIVATPKVKPGAPTTLQASINKSADEAKPGAKVASQPQSDDKSQATTGDSDKDAISQARGEIAAKDNHATAAQAPGTPATDMNPSAPQTVADALQPNALTAPTQNMTQAAASPATVVPLIAPQAPAIPLAGVAIEIASNAIEGKNHFDIRLDPPELGRIEVHLDVDKDGNVTSRVIADRSDTLDLLRRDASGLERALQDAGLKTADNGLQFSLRDHSTGQQQSNGSSNTTQLVVEDNTLTSIDIAQRGYNRLAGQGSGIDIHV